MLCRNSCRIELGFDLGGIDMKLEMEIDINKFRYGLVGDGYLYDEVINMSEEKLLTILKDRITHRVQIEYMRSQPIIRDVLSGK